MPADRLIEKARKLAETGRIEQLVSGVYNVIGDHGTYTVAQDYTGRFSCDCPGYIQKSRCSHIAAVLLFTKRRQHKPH